MNQLYILKNVPLDSDYQETITFEDKAKQQSYFLSKVDTTLTKTDYTFITPNRTLRVEVIHDDIIKCNYVMYQNDSGENFFAFIESVRYISSLITEIDIKIDVLQTFMFDYQIGDAYIEREHQDRFTGTTRNYNRELENIELGDRFEPQISRALSTEPLNVKPVVIVRKTPVDEQHSVLGLPSPFQFLLTFISIGADSVENVVFRQRVNSTTTYNLANLQQVVSEFGDKPTTFDILILPHVFTNLVWESVSDRIIADSGLDANMESFNGVYYYRISNVWSNAVPLTQFTTSLQVSDVIPPVVTTGTSRVISNESKLYTKPFRRTVVRSDLSNSREIDVTRINNFNFHYRVTISDEAKETVYLEGLTVPQDFLHQRRIKGLPLSVDAYLEYISNRKAQAESGIVVPIVQTLSGFATAMLPGGQGIGAGMILGGVTSIGSRIAQEQAKIQDLKTSPDSVKNIGNNLVHSIFAEGFTYSVYVEKIPDYYMMKAYEYFYRYGYKANRFAVPDIKSRKYFNYLKVTDVTLKTTNINHEYLRQIKDILMRGVRFWHMRTGANATVEADLFRYDRENWEV